MPSETGLLFFSIYFSRCCLLPLLYSTRMMLLLLLLASAKPKCGVEKVNTGSCDLIRFAFSGCANAVDYATHREGAKATKSTEHIIHTQIEGNR